MRPRTTATKPTALATQCPHLRDSGDGAAQDTHPSVESVRPSGKIRLPLLAAQIKEQQTSPTDQPSGSSGLRRPRPRHMTETRRPRNHASEPEVGWRTQLRITKETGYSHPLGTSAATLQRSEKQRTANQLEKQWRQWKQSVLAPRRRSRTQPASIRRLRKSKRSTLLCSSSAVILWLAALSFSFSSDSSF